MHGNDLKPPHRPLADFAPLASAQRRSPETRRHPQRPPASRRDGKATDQRRILGIAPGALITAASYYLNKAYAKTAVIERQRLMLSLQPFSHLSLNF
jgi:hypothetical protein